MELSISYADDETRIEIAGELDAMVAPELRSRLLGELSSAPRAYAVDLARVDSMDTAGLAALVGLLVEARRCGGSVRLVRVAEGARRVLELTGFAEIFEVEAVDA